MRLLLDTRLTLGAIADADRLSDEARRLIDDPDNQIVVSAATVREIAIKRALARNDMPIPGQQALRYFSDAGLELPGVSPAHSWRSHVVAIPCRGDRGARAPAR